MKSEARFSHFWSAIPSSRACGRKPTRTGTSSPNTTLTDGAAVLFSVDGVVIHADVLGPAIFIRFAVDVVNLSVDVIASPVDVIISLGDVIIFPEDVIASPEDAVTSPEDVITSPEDAITSPEDVITSPEDVISSPEDIVERDDHVELLCLVIIFLRIHADNRECSGTSLFLLLMRL